MELWGARLLCAPAVTTMGGLPGSLVSWQIDTNLLQIMMWITKSRWS